MKRKIFFAFAFAATMVISMASCVKGDDNTSGDILYLDMCELHTADKNLVDYAIADDDRRLKFNEPVKLSWTTTVDSMYRAMMYYYENKETGIVTPQSVGSVPVYVPKDADQDPDLAKLQDPVTLQTAWRAKNKKYLNLGLSVLTSSNTTKRHIIGVVCDSTRTTSRGTHYYYRLCHGRNGVPAEYSSGVYVSIPTRHISNNDTMTLRVPVATGTIQVLKMVGDSVSVR